MPALVYLRRIKSRLPNEVRGQPSTPHRVLLGSLILAAKYLNDISFKNKDWAKCSIISTPAYHFGFDLTDVNLIERQLLSLLDWDLRITEDDLYQVIDDFLCPIRADSQTLSIHALAEKALCQQQPPNLATSHPALSKPLDSTRQLFIHANNHTIVTAVEKDVSDLWM